MLLLPAAACLGADRIDVTLERLADDKWSRIDPQTVVTKGERVRFRFVSASPGWLAVYYVGSGGQSEWLSPSQLVVKDNAVVVPPDPASFTIGGPPGLDVLYWILSPKQVPLEALVPASERKPAKTLIPRCRETDPCTDDRAGLAKMRARELKVDSGSGTPERNIGVIVYEFRLAHR
jgi:hypothetical protein